MSVTYDFHTLSPLDFEELVRDLLQAHWKLHLESFGPGRDQGIDARYLNGPQNVIIQAKHLIGSGYKALVHAAAREREKAIKLSPSRYVLATSVSLSPSRKNEIIAAMDGVPLVANDIIGLEDLNNLLRQHPDIERQHFKLWLSSTTVLDRILNSGVYNRTAAELEIIQEMVPRFVQNRSVSEAERKLSERGTLIIAGPPGVGKTTLARILVWLHAEQEWNVYVVDSLEEAFRVADSGDKRLILLDDFLGQVRLSADHVRGIDARLPPLISRIAAHDNLRFVLTTRDYILAQARIISDRLAPDRINASEYVLNVGEYTRSVRAKILYNHIFFSALTPAQRDEILRDDFFLEIIDHKNFNPRIVDELTRQRYVALTDRPLRDTIKAVLKNPEILWELPYRQHITPEGRAMMLALFLNDRSITLDVLKATYVRVATAMGLSLHPVDVEPSFRTTFRTLEGSVMAHFHGMVTFANPGLSDFLQSVISGDKLVPNLLSHLQTSSELNELWSVFMAQQPDETAKDNLKSDWTNALDRMQASGQSDRYDYIGLVADLCSQLDYEPLRERLERAIDQIESVEMDHREVSKACALLEEASLCSLPMELENRFRRVTTTSAAQLLMNYSGEMTFDEITSLDDSLHTFGIDEDMAQIASFTAMENFSNYIDDEARSINTVEDLDDYEKEVVKFFEKRGFPTRKILSEIDYRRDQLIDLGKIHRQDGTYTTGSQIRDKDSSNFDIVSMFRQLSDS
ncbi:hypothetical protein NKI98_26910 [Mesorhizobium sp. M0222]|uniref:nSTAND3 domain-containing NTPase n=1 Tax=Mesorhizobium sp. M0222 TaxID=2956921 RepID=UPI00333721DB